MLSRSYRPKLFKEVMGQENVIQCLKNDLAKKGFKKPYIFHGPHGTGKTSSARIFARAILCENRTEESEPCNTCDSCLSVFRGTHPNFVEVDAASHSDVKSVRKMKENCEYSISGSKVYLIDESHNLTDLASNAFLDWLEEGEDHVFLFCTTDIDKVIKTLRSRCLTFNLSNIDYLLISFHLESICELENIEFEKEALDLISFHTAPHVRDALVTLELLRNYGKITQEIVKNNLHLNTRIDYLRIIKTIQTDISKTIKIMEKLLLNTSAIDIYNGIAEAAVLVFKYSKGFDNNLFSEEISCIKEILNLGIDFHRIGEHFLEKIKFIDNNYLFIDIIVLYEKLNGNYSTPDTTQLPPPKPSTVKKIKKKEVEEKSEELVTESIDPYDVIKKRAHFKNQNKDKKVINNHDNPIEKSLSNKKMRELLNAKKRMDSN